MQLFDNSYWERGVDPEKWEEPSSELQKREQEEVEQEEVTKKKKRKKKKKKKKKKRRRRRLQKDVRYGRGNADEHM